EADALLGRALAGLPRDQYVLVGAIGHDFYEGERAGPAGYPRFTDPRLRAPDGYRDYVRMATERSLERCGVEAFDLLLLHNPDRHGMTPLQLACRWNLAHEAVECVVPTLIQEAGAQAKPIEEKREELAQLASTPELSPEEVAELRELGDNTGSMHLKGASPEHE